MAILLALASAVVYGVSDYVGGRASRRFQPIAIALCSEMVLLAITIVLVPLVESEGPSSAAIVWGVIGGVAGTAAVLGLYAALSRGNMTVVAPVTAIVAAAVPVVVGIASGERPSGAAMIGIALALVAVALIGGLLGVRGEHADTGTVLLALAVGFGFGLLFIAYSRTGDDSGLWPLLTARGGGGPLLIVAYLVGRRRGLIQPPRREVFGVGAAIAVMIGLANALYLLSTREGLLSIVAVIVSLYPASTIALAIVLDKERASRSQAFGMLVAAVAVGMFASG